MIRRQKISPSFDSQPRRRENTLRVSVEVGRRIRDGHPWIFSDALRGRQLSAPEATEVMVLDSAGDFVGRALHDPAGVAMLRVFSRNPDQHLDAEYVSATVARAARWRRRLLDLGTQGCYRVLSGDCEGLPAVNVDRYANYLVVHAYSAIVKHYQKAVADALDQVWQPAGLYWQRRYEPARAGKAVPGAELVAGNAAPAEVIVTEGRARLNVDVTAPLGTGLFGDMRLGRHAVSELAGGRDVLNCFSYTGAFSVVAALAGARAVISVDNAARAHTRARANFKLNKLDPDASGYEFVTGDTGATLERLRSKGRKFDLIILDPPTFSLAKGHTFAAVKDYAELVQVALGVMAQGGVLCAASNAAKMTADEFERALARGGSYAGRDLLVLKRFGQPPDYPTVPGFPESNYLKFFVAVAG
jgi:23S rRNA (cytosine1962-C5)-methyltransferase